MKATTKTKCRQCSGTGLDKTRTQICSKCKGAGFIRRVCSFDVYPTFDRKGRKIYVSIPDNSTEERTNQ